MIVQSGISFDMFGLQLRFGVPREGCWQRDLFQISSLLDRFAPFGKPLMISGMQVPSQPEPSGRAGSWRKPWTEALQSKWLEAIMDIALSKPFVEAISWHDLVNTSALAIPYSGLANADLTPKQAPQDLGFAAPRGDEFPHAARPARCRRQAQRVIATQDVPGPQPFLSGDPATHGRFTPRFIGA